MNDWFFFGVRLPPHPEDGALVVFFYSESDPPPPPRAWGAHRSLGGPAASQLLKAAPWVGQHGRDELLFQLRDLLRSDEQFRQLVHQQPTAMRPAPCATEREVGVCVVVAILQLPPWGGTRANQCEIF